MISFLQRPSRRVIIKRCIAKGAEINNMAPLPRWPDGTKVYQDVWRKIGDQGNSRAGEDYLAVGKNAA